MGLALLQNPFAAFNGQFWCHVIVKLVIECWFLSLSRRGHLVDIGDCL